MSRPLAAIYQELHRNAARTGQDRRADLPRGSRLAVRVQAGVVTLMLARRGAHVGDAELEIFRRACAAPTGAQRWPAAGQHQLERDGATWWLVAFRWVETDNLDMQQEHQQL